MNWNNLAALELVLVALAFVGALNWGLVEVVDTNVVTEFVPTDYQGIVYTVVGVAGGLGVLDVAGVLDIETLREDM